MDDSICFKFCPALPTEVAQLNDTGMTKPRCLRRVLQPQWVLSGLFCRISCSSQVFFFFFLFSPCLQKRDGKRISVTLKTKKLGSPPDELL